MAEFPDHPIFQSSIFHSLDSLAFATRVREASCSDTQEDLHSIAIEKAIPAVSEELQILATQLSTTHRLSTQQYHEVVKRLERLERKIDDFSQISWNISITPTD